jgi:hypothetical protein
MIVVVKEKNYGSFRDRILSDDWIKLFNRREYTTDDTCLSYRQINILYSEGLVPDERKNKDGWRRFNLRELIYFSVVQELRGYGLKNENLKKLSYAFFGPSKDECSRIPNSEIVDVPIGLSLLGIQMLLRVNSSFNVDFFDPESYLELSLNSSSTIIKSLSVNHNRQINESFSSDVKDFRSYVLIDLSESVRSVVSPVRKKMPEHKTLRDLAERVNQGRSVSDRDIEVLKVLNDERCGNLELSKKRDGAVVINAENRSSKDELLKKSLEHILGGEKNRRIELYVNNEGRIELQRKTDSFKII